MRRWLPSFYFTETMLCYFDGEAEGWMLGIEWLGFVVEISAARRMCYVEQRD